MEQKQEGEKSNCTWQGDIYPNGYSSCEADTCTTCKNGEWVKNDNPNIG